MFTSLPLIRPGASRLGKRGGYLPGQENLGAIRHQPARGGRREQVTVAAPAVKNTDRSDYLFTREHPKCDDTGETFRRWHGGFTDQCGRC